MKIHKCFFCNKYGVEEYPRFSSESTHNKFKEDKKRMLKEIGNIKVMVGRVGNKWVCYDCAEDLHDLLNKSY